MIQNIFTLLILVGVLSAQTDSLQPGPIPDSSKIPQERDTTPVKEESFSLDELDEEEFSLDDLDEEDGGEVHSPSVARGRPGGSHIEAIVVVDWTLESLWAKKKEVSFASNHEYVILGLEPNPNSRFVIELIGLTYWEFIYSLSKDTKLKLGKIAIPFGPIFLHQVLAGIVEKPTTGGGQTHFIVPHVWSEYGAGGSHRFVDNFTYSVETEFWIVNGLEGEVRVADQTVEFSGAIKVRDNNLDKGFGFRIRNKYKGKYSLNFSFYTSKWANDRIDDEGALLEKFYEGDRLWLGNIDFEIGYNAIPVIFLKNLKFIGEYAAIRTHSTQKLSNTNDNRVPWHTKTADLIEITYNGLQKWFEVQFRYGTYDDNRNITNSRDLHNFNIALTREVASGIHVIPMYMWNREAVNEIDDDFFFIKFFIEL